MNNGYIVCYILRTKGYSGENIDTDHYEVFVDDGEDSSWRAKKRYNQLCNGGRKKEFNINQKVYSVNLCYIEQSTEATYLNIPR